MDGYDYLLFFSGQYIFLEASQPAVKGDFAQIDSQEISVAAQPDFFCFSFWYNMNGPGIGTLNVTTKVWNVISLISLLPQLYRILLQET